MKDWTKTVSWELVKMAIATGIVVVFIETVANMYA